METDISYGTPSVSPHEGNKPLSIIYDEHAEELSFLGIYLGQARTFQNHVETSVQQCLVNGQKVLVVTVHIPKYSQ
jgi:hypothetical protein